MSRGAEVPPALSKGDSGRRSGVPEARHRAPASATASAPDEELDLVRRAQEHDPKAADLLIRRYQKKVYGIAYQLCGFDPEEARDTAQEALLQVFRNLGQFEGRSRFSTWLHRIAVNACLDARRRRKRWLRLIMPRRPEGEAERGSKETDPIDAAPAPGDGSEALERIGSDELQRDLKKALRRLSEHQRTVFELKVLQEMSLAEIAAVTGMAEGTVKSHLFRATHSVRRQLRRWVDG